MPGSVLALGGLLLLSVRVDAQIDNGYSIYSRFGIGALQTFASSQTQAMGGAAVGLATVNYLNLANPATWSDQLYVRFSAGFEYAAIETSDAQNNTSKLNSGMLSALQLGIPLKSGRLGMVFAMQPYSRVGYRVEQISILQPEGSEPGSAYRSVLQGDGGLQSVVGGLGYRMGRNLYLGASGQLIFGIIDYERRTEMGEVQFFVPDTGIIRSTRLAGVTATLGAALSFPNVTGEASRLTVGATATLPARLSATQVVMLDQSGQTDTLGAPLEGSTTIPFNARLGVTYRPHGGFLFALEGRFAPWSQFSSDVPLAGYDPSGSSMMTDAWRLGGGLEWSPTRGAFHPNFFRRALYRLGGYLEQAYYEPSTGTDVQTLGATVGMSMPSLFPGTYVDLNAEFGERGTTSAGLVRDLYVMVSATINFGERWFVKRRFR